MAANWSPTRLKSSWIEVELPTKVEAVSAANDSIGLIRLIDMIVNRWINPLIDSNQSINPSLDLTEIGLIYVDYREIWCDEVKHVEI